MKLHGELVLRLAGLVLFSMSSELAEAGNTSQTPLFYSAEIGVREKTDGKFDESRFQILDFAHGSDRFSEGEVECSITTTIVSNYACDGVDFGLSISTSQEGISTSNLTCSVRKIDNITAELTVEQDWGRDGKRNHVLILARNQNLKTWFSELRNYSGTWIKTSSTEDNKIHTTLLVPMTSDYKRADGKSNKFIKEDCPIQVPALFREDGS